MRQDTCWTLLFLGTLCLSSAGCSDGSDDPAPQDSGPSGADGRRADLPMPTDGPPPSVDQGPASDSAAASIQLEMYAYAFRLFGEPSTRQDVQVCILEHPELSCASTDSDGFVQLEVPAYQDLLAEFLFGESPLDGKLSPALISLRTPGSDLLLDVGAPGVPTLLAADWADAAGITPDLDGASMLLISVYDNLPGAQTQPLSDVSFTLSAPGAPAPVYFAPEGTDPGRTVTSSMGTAVVFNVPDGQRTVSAAHPSRSCQPFPGLREVGGAASIQARGGHTIPLFFYCQ